MCVEERDAVCVEDRDAVCAEDRDAVCVEDRGVVKATEACCVEGRGNSLQCLHYIFLCATPQHY